MKSELKISSESSGDKDEIQAKLPKLTITKFNGTHRRTGTIFLGGGAEVILPECDVTKKDVISLPTSNVY